MRRLLSATITSSGTSVATRRFGWGWSRHSKTSSRELGPLRGELALDVLDASY